MEGRAQIRRGHGRRGGAARDPLPQLRVRRERARRLGRYNHADRSELCQHGEGRPRLAGKDQRRKRRGDKVQDQHGHKGLRSLHLMLSSSRQDMTLPRGRGAPRPRRTDPPSGEPAVAIQQLPRNF